MSEGVFLPRSKRFVVGCDLAQQHDYTAIAVLEVAVGVIDMNTEDERHTNTGRIPQKPARRFDCRHLQRLPLKLSYPTQVEKIKQLMSRPPLCGAADLKPAELIVDITGVGRPVGELLDRAGLRPIKVTITSSQDKATYSGDCWHVSKALIVQTIDAALNNGELGFAKGLDEAHAMESELKDFRRFVSAAGRSTYEASGQNGDLVLALGIGLWWASRPPPPRAAFGRWGQPDKPNQRSN